MIGVTVSIRLYDYNVVISVVICMIGVNVTVVSSCDYRSAVRYFNIGMFLTLLITWLPLGCEFFLKFSMHKK
ncbi:hypothetical protein T492DRAFT_988897 [Pavlovales sp. CCMP2436]|nr:hypothetical protein T492DRAFT_988897 [Pavlovales sp. CCMP2436]